MDQLYHYYPRVTNDSDDDDARRADEEKDDFKTGEPGFGTSEDGEEEAGEEFDPDLELEEEEEE